MDYITESPVSSGRTFCIYSSSILYLCNAPRKNISLGRAIPISLQTHTTHYFARNGYFLRDMKSATYVLFFFFSCAFCYAQSPATDTTIYDVAETLPYPLMVSCDPVRHPTWTIDSIRRCAESQLLSILSNNIRYPVEATEANIQGIVVTSFIVEVDGKMSNFKLLKDIGGGCGPEALRVLKAFDEAGLRWQPAQMNGKPVRMRQSLPLRFRLQESLPYYIGEQNDTIYTSVDSLPTFRGGMDSLARFVINRLDYPAAFLDSCKTGVVEMSILIRPDGTISVDNQLDFNNLGFDFQWQAIRLANRTAGMWTPAFYGDKPVATTLPLRVVFKSDKRGCTAANHRFDKAILLANEGAELQEKDETDAAIAKWTEALKLQPDNTEIIYYRGTAYLNQNKRDEACKDYNRIKELIGVTWFEPVRRLFCGW